MRAYVKKKYYTQSTSGKYTSSWNGRSKLYTTRGNAVKTGFTGFWNICYVKWTVMSFLKSQHEINIKICI